MKKPPKASKPGPSASPESAPFNSPFAALQGHRDQLPPGAATPPPAAQKPPPEPARGPARAVVRLERKGRGGKEVTRIEQLGLPAAALDTWLRALKNSLGCGGTIEGDMLVLQGDQRDRAAALLEARGVRKVIR